MKEINEEAIKAIIDCLTEGYSDLDMYKDLFENRVSIFESILENYFDSVEGFCCCGDKASYVAHMVDKTLTNNKYYPLKETYRDYQNRGGDIGSIKDLDKVAYWCPKTLNTTEDALKIIFNVVSGKFNKVPPVVDVKKIKEEAEKTPCVIPSEGFTMEGE